MASNRSTRYAGRRKGLLGIEHLDRMAGAIGGPRGPLSDFRLFRAKRDVYYVEEDFDASTMVAARWVSNALTGGTAFAYNAGLGGRVQGATGADATAGNRVVNLYGPQVVTGNAYGGMTARLQVGAAATNIEWGVGLIDAHTTLTTPVVLVGDVDTPGSFASGMGDAALVYQDTAETLTTAALVALGSSPVSNTGSKAALGTFAPTAATYFHVTVQLDGNNLYARVANADGSGAVEASLAAGINGATLLRPFVVASAPTALTKTWTIDRVAVWAMR
jgi:hypothetical protein